MKVKLVTFSDGSHGLRAAGKRLAKQADLIGWFDFPAEHWTLKTLRTKMPDFFVRHENFIKAYPKGFGLWVWKPAILSYLMSELKEGEIVLLLDAGCQLNSTQESDLRFNDYLELCIERGMLIMQLNNGSFGFEDVTDAAWTKLSVLDALDPLSTHRLVNQIQSGIIFAAKTDRSEKVVNGWLENCLVSEYSHLIDASPEEPQSKEYKQHRWEQSILSLAVKSEGIIPLADETYFYPNWQNGFSFPIWAMRNRSGGDAYRRNPMDLFLLLIAKVERKLKSAFKNEV